MSNFQTACVRAGAVRISINSRPELDCDVDPVPLDHFAIETDSNEFTVSRFIVDDETRKAKSMEPCHARYTTDAATAWTEFIDKPRDYYAVNILSGPNCKSIDLARLVAEPNHWQVFIVTKGKPRLIGRYVHRLTAMAATRIIVNAGRCPLAVSPFMLTDHEWNADYVIESTELPAAIRRALR